MIDNFLELSDKELTHIDRNKHVIRNINETQMYTNDSINSGKLSEKSRKIKEEKLDEIMRKEEIEANQPSVKCFIAAESYLQSNHIGFLSCTC